MQKPSIGAWTPPSTLTRHGRDAIPGDMYFFVAPPPEIGVVITADSSLRTPSLPQPTKAPHLGLSITVISIWVLIFVGCFLFFFITPNIISFLTLVGFVCISMLVYPRQSDPAFHPDANISAFCSYVGDRGIAEFTLPKEKPDRVNVNICCFEDFTALYVIYHFRYQGTKTKHYSHTNYTYRWENEAGIDFAIYGNHRCRTNPPELDNRWHFCRAAEAMWTHYQLELAIQKIDRGKAIEFPVLQEQWRPIELGGGRDLEMIRIYSDSLEFVDKSGDEQRFPPDQITHATVRVNDKFRFTGQNPLSLHRAWRYSAPYGDMTNAELLLACLDRFLGITCK